MKNGSIFFNAPKNKNPPQQMINYNLLNIRNQNQKTNLGMRKMDWIQTKP